ncbi:MAG: D-erythronate dehydrogenase [Actinomycetota bacterium]
MAQGAIGGRAVTAIDLVDVVARPDAETAAASGPSTPPITTMVADLNQPDEVAAMVARQPDVVFHLAGVVSGEAEANLVKGYRVNLDGTRSLFDTLAVAPGRPRVVFTSSIAVFGAPFPPVIDDDFHLTPLTSYGAQKAMGELLLADYSRRGLIDGVGIRLPTITVRPGAPNAAASGFFSSIIREPLAGATAVLPVADTVRHPHASPQSAVANLLHAAAIDTEALGSRPNLTMPSLSVTVGEQLAALERVAGADVVALVQRGEDPAVATIVAGWPEAFAADRARALGFVSEDTYDDIIRSYQANDAPPSTPEH